MKIIFAGGRNFSSVNAIRKILTYLTEMRIINYKEKITGVSGKAKGADTMFDSYNKLAGHNRNTLMAQNADILVCVYEGSAGTKHMINAMKKLGKPTYIFDYNGLPVY